jgi:hypothetical protein
MLQLSFLLLVRTSSTSVGKSRPQWDIFIDCLTNPPAAAPFAIERVLSTSSDAGTNRAYPQGYPKTE